MSAVATMHTVAASAATQRPNFSGFRRVVGPAALTRDVQQDAMVSLTVRPTSPIP